jgi:hypothetical protein
MGSLCYDMDLPDARIYVCVSVRERTRAQREGE